MTEYTVTKIKDGKKRGTPLGATKTKKKKKTRSMGANSHLTGQARKAEEALHKSSKKAQNV